MPRCAICNLERVDLSRHIYRSHHISVAEYRCRYGTKVIDLSVNKKRKQTCINKYGDPNYRNRDAIKLANEVFEGGHSLRDPNVREKAKKTKILLYGNPNFTNRVKAAQTCLEKYGVDNIAKVKSVIEKRIKTSVERYGSVFNYIRKSIIGKETLIEMHLNQGLSLVEIGKKCKRTPEGISYLMKKYGIPIKKKIVLPWMKKTPLESKEKSVS